MEHPVDVYRVKDAMRFALKSVDAVYADAFFEFQSDLAVTKNKVEEKVISPAVAGVCLRSFSGGAWKYACTNRLDWKSIVALGQKVSNPEKGKTKIMLIEPWNCDKEYHQKIPEESVSVEERLKLLRELFAAAKSVDKRIVDVRLRLSAHFNEKIILTSEGSDLHQRIPKISFACFPIAKEGPKMDYDYVTAGGVGGFEKVSHLTPAFVQRAAKSSLGLLKAVEPFSGKITAIIDSDVAGVFAHETFGHGTEADQVLRKRSYLAPYLGKRLAGKEVTVIDSAVVENGWGNYFFDDDGVPARENKLIDKGVFRSLMHDRVTAAELGMQLTGNSRTESFKRRRFVRMTNTYFAPGSWKVDEMIEGVKRGMLLEKNLFGMEDPLGGGLQCTSKKGWLIENGKLTKRVSRVAISGNILDVFRNIDAVGNKNEFRINVGSCGKGVEDFVYAGTGGVHLRIKGLTVSRG